MTTQSAHEHVEHLAEMLVLADAKDPRSLADVHSQFQNLAAWACSADSPQVAGVATYSAAMLEKMILDEVDEPARVFDDLNQVVGNLQSIIRDGRSATSLRWPAGYEVEAGEASSVQMTDAAVRREDETTAGREVPAVADTSDMESGEPDVSPAETPPEGHPLEGDLSLLGEFVNEAREHLDAADISLLRLETSQGEENQEALNAVFRAFHTIKGVAGFLALHEIERLAHDAENLLDRARKRELELTGTSMDVVFDAVDMMKSLVGKVADALQSGGLLMSTPHLKGLLARIVMLTTGASVTSGEAGPQTQGRPGQPLGEILIETGASTSEAVNTALKQQQEPTRHQRLGKVLVQTGRVVPSELKKALEAQRDDPQAPKLGEILVGMGSTSNAELEVSLREQADGQAPRLGELLVGAGQAAAKDVVQALRSQNVSGQGVAQMKETVKVDAERLDLLIDAIGELVIAESMVSQSREIQATSSAALARSMAQLDKITRELQEMGTSLRMVPIRATFQKMARLVRDLSRKSGKEVEFITTGEDTELDKSVVDKIGDPLIHMIRNAVDHGIEASADARRKAGKQPVGRVELRAFHKGGSIYIEIQDDGQGLNRDAILAKAQERGVIHPGDVLSDHEVCNLIFEPGLSTAKTVTDVSGRGVGMDVVKRNIESLRGQVEIQSESGKGSIFSIRLPLTLAIIDGMIVRVGQERYIVPTLSIVMSIRPTAGQVSTVIGRGEMLSLQGKLIPLFRLARLFKLRGGGEEVTNGIVVIVEDEGRETGLLVDEILGQQQIVIKSLGDALQGLAGIAGGAIMSDGNVGLILDISGVVKVANDDRDTQGRVGLGEQARTVD